MSDERLIQIRPTPRQIEIQKIGFYAFFHFTVNTFTGKEWGDGTEDPAIFAPEHLDAEQWVRAIKAAGMKGAILTCKHHDGFCLWPSRYTRHSVAASPYKEGRGDVVREVSEACKKYGIRFGIYLSPWDRNHAAYGTGKAYDDYFVSQLEELLTGYGDIFCVWFDGACGEGACGKKQEYDWQRYYDTVRRLQPGACISVTGPDVRWCGNEAGDTRESEWSVVPAALSQAARIAERSQQADNPEFREKKLSSMELDLGSRERLAEEQNLIWYPAEVDAQVKTVEELSEIYERSVGGNATLLLNIPPMPEGILNPVDVERLAEFGAYIEEKFAVNLAEQGEMCVIEKDERHPADGLRREDDGQHYEGHTKAVEIECRWETLQEVSAVVLKEEIRFSQRIEAFRISVEQNGTWRQVGSGTTVGFRKILSFAPIQTKGLRIEITDSRVAPVLEYAGIYGKTI